MPRLRPHHAAAEPTAAIRITDLHKSFGDVRAVAGVSFSAQAGRVTGFLGPNGSGKTTTLRALLGLVRPDRGTAVIGGRPYRELVDPLREVGAMLEASAHPGRSARDHLRVLAAEARVPLSRVDELLRLVDLDGAARRARRRVLAGHAPAARACVGADRRPAGARARRARERARPARHALAAGLPPRPRRLRAAPVLLSSHALGEVAQTADDVVVISHGRVVAAAPLGELTGADSTSLEDAFFALTSREPVEMSS